MFFAVVLAVVPSSAQQAKKVPDSAAEMALSFAPIVKRVAPSVVNVLASRAVERRQSPFFNDPFFERFFGNRDFGRPRQRIARSLGSGVIVDPSGIVVTNFHVIKGATDVKIALADKREYEAEIILRDEESDLAVLRVDPGNQEFAALSFGDSDDLEVGDIVLAIGNPFGVGQTVTQGIVSALARTNVGATDFQFFIQTDAAINPGNSGGALIDMQGRVVGINTAIFSRSGGSHGIGFAVPADMARTVVASALGGSERVVRPWVGAKFQNVTPDIAEGLGLPKPVGSLVTGVLKDSPADTAGLEVGDLIVAVEDDEISDTNALYYRIATLGIGGNAKLQFLRGRDRFETEIRLEKAPETIPRDVRLIGGRSPFTGATVLNLSPATTQEVGLDIGALGVAVVKVEPRSPAAQLRLRKGDIILDIEGKKVNTTRQLEEMTSERRPEWFFTVLRDGRLIRSRVRG